MQHKSCLCLETEMSGWGLGEQARPYVSAAIEHFVIQIHILSYSFLILSA